MKILFIQLPLLDHAHSYTQGNIEYAPATLSAYIKKRISASVAVEFLPCLISNFASNEMILRYIQSLSPDIVCFTNYLWNLERHLHLARDIASRMSGVRIMCGGPEIAPGSYAFAHAHPEVTYFVTGEGEWFFHAFFSNTLYEQRVELINENTIITQPDNALLSASEIVEPFTSNYLNAMPDGSIFLEMTRGCPFRCDYCYYSKNSFVVRELPLHLLLNAFQRHSSGLREIYILSPTFNTSPRFHETLKTIRAHNPGIRLHTEMRAGTIDRETAQLIREAGFTSLEIGLQTLSKHALASVNRRTNPDKELEGMQHLRDAGIELKIGIIPGLPGDTPAGFMNTVERLVRLGFAEYIELYPLMVLPGTRMRDIAMAKKASFMQKPPYYFLEGWSFRNNELADIFRSTEELTGYTSKIEYLPDFSLTEEGFLTAALNIDCAKISNWHTLDIRHYIQTSVFTIYLNLKNSSYSVDTLRTFLAHLPLEDQFYSIVLFSNEQIDDIALINSLHHQLKDSFHTRSHHPSDATEQSPYRFFQVFDTFSAYTSARKFYTHIVHVINIHRDNVRVIDALSPDEDYILVSNGAYGTIRRQLIHAYADEVECIAFESSEDMEDYYKAVNREFFRMEGLRLRYVGR